MSVAAFVSMVYEVPKRARDPAALESLVCIREIRILVPFMD